MLLQQFLARDDVEAIIPSQADGSAFGSCPIELLELVKEQEASCIENGGSFEYALEGSKITFSLWSPSL